MKHGSFFTILILSVVLCGCVRRNYHTFSGYAQGGVYAVKANLAGVKIPVAEIQTAIDSILDVVDNSLSGYNRNSLLSRFNAGEEITPNDCYRQVSFLSEEYRAMTGGAFDVWSAPLFDVWGFGFTPDSLPSESVIAEALKECQEHKKVNFNAIAQGYTCDLVASYLHSIGVHDMLVDIGEIYCEGLNPQGKGWTIGVDRPFDGNNTPGQDLQGIWESDGSACGIVTSGDYRKFYIHDGVKYAHTIDPRTGYPVQHDLLSATFLAPTAAMADAIATACMVMGPEKAMQFISTHNGIEGYLIMSDRTWTSEGFHIAL